MSIELFITAGKILIKTPKIIRFYFFEWCIILLTNNLYDRLSKQKIFRFSYIHLKPLLLKYLQTTLITKKK